MATETKIQQIVHNLEEGGWVKGVRLSVILAAVLFVNYLWFFSSAGFKGLSHQHGIEQAQIAREISRGNGFTTKMIRPAALWLFEKNMGKFPRDKQPDIYHAPLHPYINAAVFKVTDTIDDVMTKAAEKTQFLSVFVYDKTLSPKQLIYTYDKIIAGVQVVFFLLAVVISFFTAWRLFDVRLAAFAACMMLLCERFWDHAMSGLPQMLMLFLFSAAIYTLVRAIEARNLAKSALGWLAATAVLFGLLALTHAITIWMFAGLLLFAGFYFRPLGRDVAIMAVIFLVMYAPWMIRNQQVSGTPVGLGWYSGLYQVKGTETTIMRSLDVSLTGVSPIVFRNKIQGQTLVQMSNIYDFLGQALLAPVFFVALLHLFKRPETAHLRWAILTMWLFAVFGMSVFGMPDATTLKSNDLHVLFIPLMICYGLAFVLVMWTRLEINVKLVRLGFITLLFVLSALPFLQNFLLLIGGPQTKVQWPPYVPPGIALLGTWTTEKEIIASDMPWAVAWYADRRSIWLPLTIKDFIDLNDYKQLNNEIVGLYLTPVSAYAPFLNEIVKGEYKEWAPFILRNIQTREFPLKVSTVMPIDNECIFYADRDRWTIRED